MRMQPGDRMIRMIRSGLAASMVLTVAALVVGAQDRAASPQTASDRWEKDIQRFEAWDAQNAWPTDGVLFVGSSSIRLWKTRRCFPDLPVINRGFGGSQIPDVLHFLDRIVLKYRPAVVVFYCGDNDIAAGRTPEQVATDWRTFVARIRAALPKTPIVYLGIKPSGSRWALWPQMRRANAMIRDDCARDGRLYYVDTAAPLLTDGRPDDALFLSDRLHLNAAGYARWTAALRPILNRAIASRRQTAPSTRTDTSRGQSRADARRKDP